LEIRSFLRRTYYTPPFKVANITEDKRDPLLRLMLMCSSPGVLDGDDYSIRVELGEGSRMRLYTQSYQRLFHMKRGAVQAMEVHLEKGASFFYLPHPSVPHAHSIFAGRNRIYLSEGCQLVWGEVLTCGRKLSGESFSFSKFHSVTDVVVQGKLVLRENICLQPLVSDVQAIGQLEGFTHQASLLLMGRAPEGGAVAPGGETGQGDGEALTVMSEEIRAWLSVQEGVLSGVSAGPAGSLVIRLLGNKAEQLYGCLQTIVGSIYFSKPFLYAS